MPSTAAGFIFGLGMSPSGKLLAVAGSGGLQVFHYKGGSPITPIPDAPKRALSSPGGSVARSICQNFQSALAWSAPHQHLLW